MTLKRDHSKFRQIADTLAEEIAMGKLRPGERIQSARGLAERFHTSLSAVSGAFEELEKRGLLMRKARSGVFVAEEPTPLSGIENKILLCMPSQGHFFHDLFMVLFERLTQHGIVPLLIDSTQVFKDTPQAGMMTQVHEILSSRPAAAVVFGSLYWQNPFLDRYPELKKVFLLELDAPWHAGIHAVLLDHQAASRLSTQHLLQAGCRRIVYAYGPVPRHPENGEARTLLHYEQSFSGYEMAMREAGCVPRIVPVMEHEITPELLRQWFAADALDGIVCELDHTAHCFAKAALALGIRIPEQLKLTGCFNTPWSRHRLQPLTSVAFDMEEIADRLIGVLKDPARVPGMTLTAPRLIIRASTVAGMLGSGETEMNFNDELMINQPY